jgi:predicted SnoaL-like aldol condensation-catalyzing enzyme
MPNKQINVKNVVAEGDLVVVHSELVVRPKGERMGVVHIHRFQGGRIVELWDCSQMIPADSPNKDGAF